MHTRRTSLEKIIIENQGGGSCPAKKKGGKGAIPMWDWKEEKKELEQGVHKN